MKATHIEVRRGSPWWNYAWGRLASEPINASLSDPTEALDREYREVWQFMGAWRTDRGLVAQFRHRAHPVTGKREYREYPLPVGGES